MKRGAAVFGFAAARGRHPACGHTIDDLELIQNIRSGQRDAYAHLVRKYQAKVLRLCSSLLGNPTAAEDAAQEIFIKAYQALDAFRGNAAFATWLYRIAANHCKDLLRKRARQKTESWDALVESQGEQVQELLAPSPDPSAAAANAELIDRLLSPLSPDYRLVLTLREAEGLSYQEIADVMKCSVDSVKARLRRARLEVLGHARHFSGKAGV